jgi:hypothetical protein
MWALLRGARVHSAATMVKLGVLHHRQLVEQDRLCKICTV